MLELRRRHVRLLPGLDRREFLQFGAFASLGLGLPRLLSGGEAGQSEPGRSADRRDTSVILFWMAGGPSQLDTYDMKPDAPPEVRGPFGNIDTNLPGFQVCDLLPRHAQIANQTAILRTISHTYGVHDDAQHLVQTGYPLLNARQRGQQHPAEGAVTSALRGPNRPGLPAYVCIPEDYATHAGFYQQAVYLGSRHNALNAGGDPSLGNYKLPEFRLRDGLDVTRVAGRKELLSQIDQWKRDLLVTGGAAREAFDLDREPPAVRERYGRHFYGQSALLARRLVEAGVTFVTINLYERDIDWWDDHYTIEKNLRKRLPTYDQALCTLIQDLSERGLLDRTLVAAYGDFGRAPQIDSYAGRGHWPWVMSALLAGGGVRGGQIIGSTDATGGQPRDRKLTPGDLLASVYHVLGIDSHATVPDRQNRPVPLVESGEPIRELF
ncbi:MAG: DUF1501 domain-containing protein [Planctomycetota bacterium]|nr:DUF1501 domain-containing protein [Planctomycetota bacterium]